MRAAPYEEGPRCPCKASGPSSQTKTRTLRGVRSTSLRRKEITWQFQKRHPKQKHRRHVPTAERKWSLSVSNQFCLVGNSRISLWHARSAVLRKSSGSSAFVIRNLPEEMVLDRRPRSSPTSESKSWRLQRASPRPFKDGGFCCGA